MMIKGFTLIELLILLAILSLFSSIAYPIYQDYHKKNYIIEGISFTDGIQSEMEKYFSEKGTWPNANQINIQDITSESISGIWAGSHYKHIGFINIYFNEKVVSEAESFPTVPPALGISTTNNSLTLSTLQIISEGVMSVNKTNIQWVCISKGSGIEEQWLPSICRESIQMFNSYDTRTYD